MQNNRLILQDTTKSVFFSNFGNTCHAHLETKSCRSPQWARARNRVADLEGAGGTGSSCTQARDQGANGLPPQQRAATPLTADAQSGP